MKASYQVTIRLTVTDEKALRSAADELAEAIEAQGWREFRRGTPDDLLVLLDLGDLPGVKILETLVDPVSPPIM